MRTIGAFAAAPDLVPTGTFRGWRPEYRLMAPLVYELGGPEAGFVTDLASTPWLTRQQFPPDGPWSPGAIVHDWLYGRGQVSRAVADWVFLEAMSVLGVPLWRRVLMWAAVRSLGWLFYGKP